MIEEWNDQEIDGYIPIEDWRPSRELRRTKGARANDDDCREDIYMPDMR